MNEINRDYITAYYGFKMDLLTNTLAPKIQSMFIKKNVSGKRIQELATWLRDYLNGLTTDIPLEISMMKKELKL